MSKNAKLSASVTVRLTSDEAAELAVLARRLNMTYSSLVRFAVRQAIHPRHTIQDGIVMDYGPYYALEGRTQQEGIQT